jgi:hypothetical protein
MRLFTSLGMNGNTAKMDGFIGSSLCTSGCRPMNQRYRICAVDGDLSWTSPYHVQSILFMQFAQPSEVLETGGKNASIDSVELGEAREEGAWDLRKVSMRFS